MRKLGRIAAAGMLAGAFNAFVLLLPGSGVDNEIDWHLVPSGAVHGALLALVGVQGGRWFRGARTSLRVLVAAAAAWVGGFVSTLPIVTSLDHTWFPSYLPEWWEPFATFGLASGIVCGWLLFASATAGRRAHLGAGIVAGIAGYGLFWWPEDSLINHPLLTTLAQGTSWGIAVGLATAAISAEKGRATETDAESAVA
jgi:hypothetical protein